MLINLTVDALISAHQFIIHDLTEYKERGCLFGTTRPTAKRPLTDLFLLQVSFLKYQHRWTETPQLGSLLLHIVHTPTGMSTHWPDSAAGKM